MKDQRAAAKIERDAKQAAAKVERDAAKAAAAASGATQVKEPKKKASKKQQQQQPSASPQSLTTPTSPVVLPTGPTTEPDLTHILVRRAISAKFPKATHKLNHSLKNKPFIIGITGGTASGKTTVCDEIRAKLGQRVAMLQMDRFYYSLPHDEPASSHNFDVPEAFDWDLFSETLRKLSTGIPVQVPRYSFETHQRLPKLDTFKPAEVIMVEGILTLHDPRIFEQFDLKVFIEADSDVRLARRIVRDIAERGRTVEGVIDQYINTVKPAHERYIQPVRQDTTHTARAREALQHKHTRSEPNAILTLLLLFFHFLTPQSARQADIIVPHNGPKNGIAIDLLAQHISTEIYKRGATLVRQPKSPSSAAASASNSVANKTIAENGDAPTANGAPKAKKARKPRQPKEKSPAAPAADATVAAAPVDAPSQ